jgi:hypothetical protein
VLVGDHPAAQDRPGPVDHGLAQVREGFVLVLDTAPGAVHRDEGVLHDLLGDHLVAQEHRRQPDQRPVVVGVQSGDSLVGVPPGAGGTQLRDHDCHTPKTRNPADRFT